MAIQSDQQYYYTDGISIDWIPVPPNPSVSLRLRARIGEDLPAPVLVAMGSWLRKVLGLYIAIQRWGIPICICAFILDSGLLFAMEEVQGSRAVPGN